MAVSASHSGGGVSLFGKIQHAILGDEVIAVDYIIAMVSFLLLLIGSAITREVKTRTVATAHASLAGEGGPAV
jgi:hypothetical protein